MLPKPSLTRLPKGKPRPAGFSLTGEGSLARVNIRGQYRFIFKGVSVGNQTAFFQCFLLILV